MTTNVLQSVEEKASEIATKVAEVLKNDRPIIERSTVSLIEDLGVLYASHGSTAQMSSEVLHRVIDLLIELVCRNSTYVLNTALPPSDQSSPATS